MSSPTNLPVLRRNPPSTRWMRLTLRLRRFGTRWSLTRTRKRMAREEQRLKYLLLYLDAQNLRLKLLDLKVQELELATQELEESLNWRILGQLPPSPEQTEADLDQLLGL